MVIMMKAINEVVQYSEVQDDHVRIFKKRGWTEAPKNVKIEEKKPEPVYNTDLTTATREVLIDMATEKGLAKGKAAQMKKENLIKYITDGETN